MTDPSLSGWLADLSPAALNVATFGILFLEGLGLPILPGVLPMLAQASLVEAGRTTFTAAVAWAVLGDLTGALTVYVLGRWGARFVPLAWRSALQAQRSRAALERWGFLAVFFSRWLVSFRVPVTLGAALTRMPFTTYFWASALGAVLHVILWQLLLGHFGPRVLEALDPLSKFWPWLLVALIGWGAFEVWRSRRGTRGGRTDRV